MLPISGIKAVLLAHLILGIVEKKPNYTVLQIKEIKRAKKKIVEPNTARWLSLFLTSAYWRILELNSDEILNPTNSTFAAACAPTANKDKQYTEKEFVPKYNFDEKFDIPVFQAKISKVRQMKGGKILYDKRETSFVIQWQEQQEQ